MDFNGVEVLVVGAGLSGLTVARNLADAGRKVVVLEKRGELGGLCAVEEDEATGIEVHKYGTHVLHSQDPRAIDFLKRYCILNYYRHRVYSLVRGQVYRFPINLHTISQFFDGACFPGDWQAVPRIASPQNFEDAAINEFGIDLYEAFIYGYTKKQWGVEPNELPVELLGRIRLRNSYETDYFTDPWQGLPIEGYQTLFKRLAHGLSLHLNVDYNEVRGLVGPETKVVYTGPLDAYFDYRFGRLPWRGVRLEMEGHATGNMLGMAVLNIPDLERPFTRMHEFRHLRPERILASRSRTIVAKEFSVADGEPAYPVQPEGEMARAYRLEASKQTNVFFCGRLGTYRYLNMDTAVVEALQLARAL